LGLHICKNCLPYNLCCVGGDVKPYSIQFNLVSLDIRDFFILSFGSYSASMIGDTEVASGRDAQLIVPLDDMGIIAVLYK